MILNALYHTNNLYCPYMAVSICSLLENNKHFDCINIHIMSNCMSNENEEKIKKLILQYNRDVYIYEASGIDEKLKHMNIIPHYNTYITYYKLFFSHYIKIELDNLVFFDSDTIINNKLDELVLMKFTDNELFAMTTGIMFDKYKEIIGIQNNQTYFNGGVIVFNVKKYIEEDILDNILKEAQKKSYALAADEPLLNILFNNRIKRFHLKYNAPTHIFVTTPKDILKYYDKKCTSIDEIEESKNNTVIYHLAGGVFGRPWESDNKNPLTEIFDNYIKLTPYKELKKKPRKMNINNRIQRFLWRYLPKKLYYPIFRYFAIENIKNFK